MQNSRLGKYTLFYDNSEEFHELKREIFTTQIYYLELAQQAPTILDAGAHIGLATLYFKSLHPDARIIAIEPLAENAVFLEKNMFENQIADVEIHHAALAKQSGSATFYFDSTHEHWFSSASLYTGAWNGAQTTESRVVPTISLTSLLQKEHFDLVKLDIEGAELGVLSSAKNCLQNAENFLIEVHKRKDNTPEQIEKLFSDQGFSVQTQQLTKHGLSLLHASKK